MGLYYKHLQSIRMAFQVHLVFPLILKALSKYTSKMQNKHNTEEENFQDIRCEYVDSTSLFYDFLRIFNASSHVVLCIFSSIFFLSGYVFPAFYLHYI